MSIVRIREILLGALASGVLAGCGGVGRLNPDAPRAVDLSGTWLLDRAASDDPQKLLDKLRPKPDKYNRGMADDGMDPYGPDTSQQGQPGGGGTTGGGRGGGRRSQQAAMPPTYRNNEVYTHVPVMRMLMANVARGEQVTVRQTPNLFSLDYGTTVRTFTPGAVSVVSAEWGVADQSSGWKGKEYVIEVKPQTGVAAIERYGLSDDGKHLVEQLHLGGGNFPSVDLRRVYDHTDKPLPRGLPTND